MNEYTETKIRKAFRETNNKIKANDESTPIAIAVLPFVDRTTAKIGTLKQFSGHKQILGS